MSSVYLATLLTLPPSVFWSPDEGAKFIQMHGRFADAASPHRLAYMAAPSDPQYTFYPAAPIYPRPLWPSGIKCHWPAFFPAVSLPFFRVFGVWGLYVIPMACGILSAVLAGALARRLEPRAVAPAILLAGLGAPLFFHSALFLEHTLACAAGLGTLWCGGYLGSDSSRRRAGAALAALACLFAFLALRDEAVIFVAAIACAAAYAFPSGWKRMVLFACMFLLALAPLASPRWTAASGNTSRAAELAGDAARALAGLKNPALWRELPQHVPQVLVNSPGQSGVPLSPAWALAALAGLGLCGLSWAMLPPLRIPCWLAGACLVGAASAIGLCLEDRYRTVHGLLLPMPCLVLAWLPTHSRRRPASRAGKFLAALLPAVLVIHVLATWLLRRLNGGPEWGLRYAMIAYLLAAVLGAVAVTRFSLTSGGWRRLAGMGMAALLFALSCGYGVRGVIEVQVTKRDLQAFEREIRDAGCPIVTDQWWLASALAPTFVRTEFYTLNSREDPVLWLERIGPRVRSFLYLSYDTPPDTLTTAHAPTATLTQRRVIQNMTFSRFAVRGTP